MLRPRVTEYRLGDYLPGDLAEIERSITESITDVDSAKSYRYCGQDLGWGALSSAIMELRDPLCDSPEARALLQRLAVAAVRSYRGVEAFLKSAPAFDRIYIFNGRFACTRGALRACETHGVADVVIHERGSSTAKYELFRHCMPHDRAWWQEEIESVWNSTGDPSERDAVGRSFFERLRGRTPTAWKSFVDKQDPGLLPNNWNNSKRNIGVFTSSEDEFVAIGDLWENPIYKSQSDAVERLIRDALARFPGVHFYVRMHPNLVGIANKEVNKMRALRSPNLTLIEPESKISTYALLDAVDRVITYGSTIGIEATFWRKVSIMAGHALYEHLDVVYRPANHAEMINLLEADLEPKSFRDSIKYGFCMQTFGTPFIYWKAHGFEDGRFRGRPLMWEATTYLERRILMECLTRGFHSPLVHDLISGASRVVDYSRDWLRHTVRKDHG
jgi:hypothetical protein